MKQLIILSAVPGSGKSTWAKKYQATHPNTYIISSDEIRFELTGQYQDFSKQKEVWEEFENRLLNYSKQDGNFTVILDAVIDLNSLRKKYYDLGKDFDRKILVILRKPLELLKKLNKERKEDKWVPEDVLINLYNKFEEPTKDLLEIFDEWEYITVYFH